MSLASGSLREAFRGWLAQDAEAARTYVEHLPPGRRMLAMAGALGESLESPKARADWADGLSDDTSKRRLLSRALAEWGRSKNAPDAIEWLGNNGGLVTRTDELSQLMRAWADHDSQAASQALASMDAGPGRDAAVVAMVTVIAPHQGEAARVWAETVDNELKRSELLALVAKIGGGGSPLQTP